MANIAQMVNVLQSVILTHGEKMIRTPTYHVFDLLCSLDGSHATAVTGRVLTAESMNAFNTFEAPNTVMPIKFDGATLDSSDLTITLPAMSMVAVTLS
jgi:alpha-L-arabinofuranosidase